MSFSTSHKPGSEENYSQAVETSEERRSTQENACSVEARRSIGGHEKPMPLHRPRGRGGALLHRSRKPVKTPCLALKMQFPPEVAPAKGTTRTDACSVYLKKRGPDGRWKPSPQQRRMDSGPNPDGSLSLPGPQRPGGNQHHDCRSPNISGWSKGPAYKHIRTLRGGRKGLGGHQTLQFVRQTAALFLHPAHPG
ncbi:hypothetical protein J1605_020600 [Eschrichtius robustus]|uniref:Uncharacterized protein n=1 Tax=Eschrichtius robustus TaxID=9764 RepID=A0AB34HJ22_ESCRO|nr:hypothetical protein J1605_020600 [Eschrichtius robustus]